MQRYFSNELENDKLILDTNDLNHIKNVMRFKENDEITVVYDKKVFLCSLNSDLKSCKIIKETAYDEEYYTLRLFVPILQEDKMDLILQKGTELGVKEFIPVEMTRCKYKISSDKKDKKIERWKKICKEASEQSERNFIPEIKKIISFKEIDSNANYLLVCSLEKENTKSIHEAFKKTTNNDIINIVFGPEGGLTKEEELFLQEKGYDLLTFGSQILRTETVPLYISSIIRYIYMKDVD